MSHSGSEPPLESARNPAAQGWTAADKGVEQALPRRLMNVLQALAPGNAQQSTDSASRPWGPESRGQAARAGESTRHPSGSQTAAWAQALMPAPCVHSAQSRARQKPTHCGTSNELLCPQAGHSRHHTSLPDNMLSGRSDSEPATPDLGPPEDTGLSCQTDPTPTSSLLHAHGLSSSPHGDPVDSLVCYSNPGMNAP